MFIFDKKLIIANFFSDVGQNARTRRIKAMSPREWLDLLRRLLVGRRHNKKKNNVGKRRVIISIREKGIDRSNGAQPPSK